MSTLFHPHVMCVWGDILIGLGTSVVTFKPSIEIGQTSGECINHLYNIHHFGITISTFYYSTAQFLLSFLGPLDL